MFAPPLRAGPGLRLPCRCNVLSLQTDSLPPLDHWFMCARAPGDVPIAPRHVLTQPFGSNTAPWVLCLDFLVYSNVLFRATH